MSQNLKTEELIIAYLRNELTHEERLSVEKKLQHDEFFAAQFQNLQMIDHSLQKLEKIGSYSLSLTDKIMSNIEANKNSHTEIASEDNMMAYLQNELNDQERQEFKQKLAADKEFSDLFNQYQKLDHSLKTLEKVTSSELKVARILHNIQKQLPEEHKASSPIKVLLFAAAAVLFLGFSSYYLLNQAKNSSSNKNTTIANHSKENVQASTSSEYAALDWLKGAQAINGAWEGEQWGAGEQYTVGLTGLSLLAFASSSQCTNEKYATTVQNATKFILATQNADGSFGPAISNRLYNQGITTVALLKIRENCPTIVPNETLEKAVQYIVNTQTEAGGWSYTNERNDPNSSISIWQLHSLILAKKLGFENLEGAIQKSLSWLQKISDDKGVVGYKKPSDYPFGQDALVAMSSVFWLYEDELIQNDPEVTIEYKLKFKADLEKMAIASDKNLNYYQFYFLTSALQKLKEKHQFDLAHKVENVLVTKQVRTGNLYGSWDPNDAWGPTGGRIYSTAMASISLASLRQH